MNAFAALVFLQPATVAFVVAVIYLCRNRKGRAHSNLPPGSMGLPLVGETFSLLKPCSVTAVGEFMEQRLSRYGNIFSSNILCRPTVVSADVDLNRFVLRNDLRMFTPAELPARDSVLGRWSISLVVGDAHRRFRSSIVEFFSGERIRTLFLEDADRLAALVLSSWRENTTISAFAEAIKFSLYITAKKLASISPEDTRIGELHAEYDIYIKGLACLPIYMPGTVYWKALQSRENILNIFKREMARRSETAENQTEVVDDYVDDYLGLMMKKPDCSTEQITDLVLGVLLAGYDTSSKAISAMIYFLHGCPSAVAQLRKEHLQIDGAKRQSGRSKLSWEDYKAMEFTKCVVNETLRLTNVAAFILKRAIEDVEFKGYVIPKGWNVILSFSSVHLDPSIYDDPEQFNPWRWQCSPEAKMTNSFMPFGSGVRFCPGAELARMEMAVFLHYLILKYDWELVEADAPMRTPFTKFHKGLPITVRARRTESSMAQSSSS